MKDNIIGKALFGIGIITIIIGSLGSAIYGMANNNLPIILIGIAVSFISGMCFVGFGEIINLLERQLFKQDLIINILNSQKLENKVTSLKASLENSKGNSHQI